MSSLRFRVEPLDVPPDVVAKRLGITGGAFTLALDALLQRGFPQADPTTGNYDIEAVDAWRRARHGGAGLAEIARPDLMAERINRL